MWILNEWNDDIEHTRTYTHIHTYKMKRYRENLLVQDRWQKKNMSKDDKLILCSKLRSGDWLSAVEWAFSKLCEIFQAW